MGKNIYVMTVRRERKSEEGSSQSGTRRTVQDIIDEQEKKLIMITPTKC